MKKKNNSTHRGHNLKVLFIIPLLLSPHVVSVVYIHHWQAEQPVRRRQNFEQLKLDIQYQRNQTDDK